MKHISSSSQIAQWLEHIDGEKEVVGGKCYILWYHLNGMSTPEKFSNTILMKIFCKN